MSNRICKNFKVLQFVRSSFETRECFAAERWVRPIHSPFAREGEIDEMGGVGLTLSPPRGSSVSEGRGGRWVGGGCRGMSDPSRVVASPPRDPPGGRLNWMVELDG